MTFTTAAITLILVMDPFGNIPLFMSVLRNIPPRRRTYIIIREMIIALAILTLALFFGRFIITGMNISEPAVEIAGGIILFLIALRMIFPSLPVPVSTHVEAEDSPLIVPLAVPFVAGPSSTATVILFSTRAPEKNLVWLGSIMTAWVITTAILLVSDYLSKFLGERLIKAVERLMGMILTTMAVQMLLQGIADFIRKTILPS